MFEFWLTQYLLCLALVDVFFNSYG
jgi:hypothetical protein